MKALRYLLIVVAMVSVLGAYAQGTARLPEVPMQSTSVMVGSGSSLPQAAVTGVETTDNGANGSTSGRPGHIRRERPGDWDDPYKNPIGDAAFPLALLALAYVGMRVFFKRKRA